MWIEETKNGKYKFVERYEDYYTGKTKKVSVTLDRNTPQSRKIAQKTLDQKIAAAMEKTVQKDVSLKELVEEYRKDQKLTVKQSTYSRNFHACNAIMRMLGETTLAGRLTAKYVRDRFLASGKAPGTLNEHLSRFRALIRWGYKADLISDISFLDKIEPFKDLPHKAKIQDKYLESEEVGLLLRGMQTEAWRLLTEFLILSGLRLGEAIALTKEDVDIAGQAIHVTKTYDSINEEVTSPKTLCSIRDVYMQNELKTVCKRINAHMLRQRLMNGLGETELFMHSKTGGYIRYFAYNKYLRENSERILGRKLTAHALRHTHASLLLEQGVSIDAISRRLGHENSRITREIYLHVTEKLKERDNEQISRINLL